MHICANEKLIILLFKSLLSNLLSVNSLALLDYKFNIFFIPYIRIKLSDLKIGSSAIKSGSSKLSVQASDISLKGNAHWHYREHSW